MLFKKLVVPMCEDYYKSNCSKLVFYKTDIDSISLEKDLAKQKFLYILLNNGQSYNIPISSPRIMFENIHVQSHIGTWYSIDHKVYGDRLFLLLESETFGDEVPCIIIDLEGNLVLEDVFNGFDDLEDYFDSQKEQSKQIKTDNTINIVVENGLIEAVYADNKELNVSIIDLDTENPSLKKYLIDKIKNLKIDKYDIL